MSRSCLLLFSWNGKPGWPLLNEKKNAPSCAIGTSVVKQPPERPGPSPSPSAWGHMPHAQPACDGLHAFEII